MGVVKVEVKNIQKYLRLLAKWFSLIGKLKPQLRWEK